MERIDTEKTTHEQWLADLNAPLYQRTAKVGRRVAEQELAMFKQAQSVLQG